MNSNLPVIEHLNFDWEFCPKFHETMISGDENEYIFEKVNIPHSSVEIPFNNFDENMYQIDCCYRKKFLSQRT
jgi:beta-galactosidase